MECYRKSLGIVESVLGLNHSLAAISYINMSYVYFKKFEYDESLRYLRRAARIREKGLGRNHLGTATCYNKIGLVLMSKGKYKSYHVLTLQMQHWMLANNYKSCSETGRRARQILTLPSKSCKNKGICFGAVSSDNRNML